MTEKFTKPAFLFLSLLVNGAYAQPLYQAAYNMGGAGTDYGYGIHVDAGGNIYTTGYFSGTADFNPAGASYNLTATGTDIFASKLSSAGAFVWAKQMGGTGSEEGRAIYVDAAGNVYTTGNFAGIADFNPGGSTFNLTASGTDIFVSKLDAAGNFAWARRMGGTANDYGRAIKVDATGNVFTTGYFTGTADFDPGAGTFNLTTSAWQAIFVSKLDPSGNFLWAKKMGAGYEYGHSLYLDADASVYTTGAFEYAPDFDPGPGTYALSASGGLNPFVSKLDSFGNFVWARSMGGGSAGSDLAYGIYVDAGGNVYTTGVMGAGVSDFDPGAGTFNLTNMGSFDVFVSKLDASGNFLWAKQLASAGTEYGNSIYGDGSGNVYITGFFVATVDFDPGPGVYNLTYWGGTDIYVCILDAAGDFVCAGNMGGIGSDNGNSIYVNAGGDIFTTGDFSGTADFDPRGGTANLSSSGGSPDIFVSKLSSCAVLPVNMLAFTARNEDDGNILQWSTASEANSDYFSVERSIDGTDFTGIGNVKAAGNSISLRQYEFIDREVYSDYSILNTQYPIPNTIYYRLKQTDYDGKFTYSKTTTVTTNNGQQMINISPNPNNGKFILRIKNNEQTCLPESSSACRQGIINDEVNIYNVLGEKVFSTTNLKPQISNEIDISNLSGGMYFLKAGNTQTKFMKQ